MKSEDTVLDNEKTHCETTKKEQKGQVLTNKKDEKKSNGGIKLAAGLGAGAVIGAAASFLTTDALASGTQVQSETSENGELSETQLENVGVVVDEGIDIAECVTDDMTFTEAFDAARTEVGAGGAFVWHDQIYHTYTADEWSSMSQEEKDEFGSNFRYTTQELNQSEETESVVENSDEVIETSDDVDVVEEEVEVVEDNIDVAEEYVEAEDYIPDVEILGVEYDEATGESYGSLVVDGQDVVLVDVDGDGVFDVMASDMNNDNEFSVDEVLDVSADNLAVNDLAGALLGDESLYESEAGMPDYINDASDDFGLV